MRSVVFLVSLFCIGLEASPAAAADPPRILVTFADPGLSHASRAGPARPGYGRRNAPYLVSVAVRRAADRVARDLDLRIVDEWPIVPLEVHCLVYAPAGGDDVEALLDRLRARPEVESAQRMNEFHVLGEAVNDPYTLLQHNVDTLELLQAHAWSRGAGSTVTIIDTGADFRHPEIAAQVDEHVDFVAPGDGLSVPDSFVADRHGTAVAGIIGAAADNGIGMVGVAPSARLRLLKACWYADDAARAVCNSFTLAKALAHAVESGAQVVNLSLGGPPDPLLARLLGLALREGATVVTAAPPGGAGFPADVPGVIVVHSASADAGNAGAVPLSAPGDEILVPVPGGGYDYASGTSLAAAQVSGIAALLVAERPELTGKQVVGLLAASRVDEGVFVNACRALAELLGRTGCRDDATAHADDVRSEAGGETEHPL
ncbi:MAG TPA: S8 family serine peptidase [Woeseiaceae bacterium]|nr:S8 family serine peptidase [Woeseiaceae bacterium]